MFTFLAWSWGMMVPLLFHGAEQEAEAHGEVKQSPQEGKVF